MTKANRRIILDLERYNNIENLEVERFVNSKAQRVTFDIQDQKLQHPNGDYEGTRWYGVLSNGLTQDVNYGDYLCKRGSTLCIISPYLFDKIYLKDNLQGDF